MAFRDFVYNLLRFTLLFGFNTVVFSSFIVPKDLSYFISAAILFSIAIYLHKQLLSFLTVKAAFLTRVITITILVGVVFFIMETILPGFAVNAWNMKAISLGVIEIAPMEFGKYVTMVLIAFFDALFAAAMYSLHKDSV